MLGKWKDREKKGPKFVVENDGMREGFWVNHRDICLKINDKKELSSTTAIAVIFKYFDLQGRARPSVAEITALLNSPFTKGDTIKTFHLLRYFQLSQQGLFITNENVDKTGGMIKYIGAENWESVMCYMDALLFAMFANLDSFEPILFLSNRHNDPLVNRLSNLLRVYVNLLRSGNLIKTDLTIHICETLHKLGFTEALSHKQQDSSTLFGFLTEVLSMPLLTFKVDIKHGGKFNKDDDSKYSKERMLFVSLPEEYENVEGDAEILLEECLEHYFNNSISVKRELERRATLDSKNGVELVDNIDDQINLSDELPSKLNTHVRVRTRSSTLSIWTANDEDADFKPKEVSLPAWMFLRLLPFYTDDNNLSVSHDGNVKSTATSSKEFAKRRPVLPICLKRYSFENQVASRLHRKVIIPPIIHLPSFVADENDDTKSGHTYKLVLESAICHRGVSISSGHFVSAVRKDYHKINETDDEAYTSPWFLYDDMHKPKVVEKTFKEVFNTEWPYMLFYRLISYEESGYISTTASVVSSTGSSKVIVPQGSKSKYWEEPQPPTLSPIMSASNSPSITASTLDSLKHSASNLSVTSNPLPEVSPLDPKFVDIRDKYYWYIPDENMNYYKEDAASKPSTRRPSLTAPFRRNSQWSEGKAPVNDIKAESKLDIEGSSSPSSSFWRLRKKNSVHDLETTISNISLNTPAEVDPASSGKTSDHRHHIHHVFTHGDDIHRSYKRARKKRDAYKKEKCVIC